MINLGLATVATLCCLQHEASCQNKTEWKARCGLRVCAQCRAPAAARPRAGRGGGRPRAGAEKKERNWPCTSRKGVAVLQVLQKGDTRERLLCARALARLRAINSKIPLSLRMRARARARARECDKFAPCENCFYSSPRNAARKRGPPLPPSLPTPRRRSGRPAFNHVRSFLSIGARLISDLMFARPAPSALDWSVPFRAQVLALLTGPYGQVGQSTRSTIAPSRIKRRLA